MENTTENMTNNHDGLLVESTKLAKELRERGDDWADKDAAYRALEDVQKSVLAQAFLNADGGVAEREHKARASALFTTHLDAMAKARKEANKAKVAYDVFRIYVELQRTNASSHRAMVNMQ